jgi:hypothetical protein
MNSKIGTKAKRHGASAHLTARGNQVGNLFIAIDRAQDITHLHEGIALGKCGTGYPSGLLRNGWQRRRMQGHVEPPRAGYRR